MDISFFSKMAARGNRHIARSFSPLLSRNNDRNGGYHFTSGLRPASTSKFRPLAVQSIRDQSNIDTDNCWNYNFKNLPLKFENDDGGIELKM